MPASPALTPEHHEGIGHVVTTWARLEADMIRAFEGLLGLKLRDVIVLFWHMGFGDRRDRLSTLVEIRLGNDETARRQFKQLIKRLEEAYDVRNVVAHSLLRRGGARGVIKPTHIRVRRGTFKVSGLGDFLAQEFTVERFHEEAAKIASLDTEFRKFFRTRFGAIFYDPTKEPTD
jgi:hypothetical protein